MPDKRSGHDFGLEALEEIMSSIDNGKVLIIFASYNEAKQHVITSNEGFSRRVLTFLVLKI
ncbi:hypothetical protein Patl1_27432 [Pistacia atlantica]|uniref:Uncharacterized protein n=1 Tax=Pistacia atlantica TaxID=434234 RepID=A0ACC1BEB3_9ROSI|nr:hypothetical protein Patl1_27432 [Pistacia atlantica]